MTTTKEPTRSPNDVKRGHCSMSFGSMKGLQSVQNSWTTPHSHLSDAMCRVGFYCKLSRVWVCMYVCLYALWIGQPRFPCHVRPSWKFATHDSYVPWQSRVFSVITMISFRSAHPVTASRPWWHVPTPQSALTLCLSHPSLSLMRGKSVTLSSLPSLSLLSTNSGFCSTHMHKWTLSHYSMSYL